MPLEIARRSFLTGFGSLIAAPAIVPYARLMKVKVIEPAFQPLTQQEFTDGLARWPDFSGWSRVLDPRSRSLDEDMRCPYALYTGYVTKTANPEPFRLLDERNVYYKNSLIRSVT